MIEFTKMHGLGNDFIVVDCRENTLKNPEKIAVKLCDRHFGIGADGLILVLPSNKADLRMRIFNPDGSEPEMCGNGIRCFAKFVKDNGFNANKFEVETLAGIIKPEIIGSDVRVDMGEPILNPKDVPANLDGDMAVDEELEIDGRNLRITAVSMGNPHTVSFVETLEGFPIAEIGAKVELHPTFPKKTNVEFVQVMSNDTLKVAVWERGAGITLACGTGACASLVAAVLNKKITQRSAKVQLPGGDLHINWADDNHVYMTGPAETVFIGNIKI
jgi:diaminopimelate epimerase